MEWVVGRPVVLSNGHILVGLNDRASVHDFYYPYIGQDNLTTARNLSHKIGIWVDGQFSWLENEDWQIDMDFESEALVSEIWAENRKLSIKLHFKDFIDSHYPTFCRIIEITNLTENNREIRLFMHQAFQISRAGRSDTALFIPEGNYLLDYKGWSSLLIYLEDDRGQPFDQFAVGNYGIEGKEGTFKDAEDGQLSGSLVEHGGVDSVVARSFDMGAGQTSTANYWIIATGSQVDAEEIHHVFLSNGIKKRLESTRQSWGDWLSIAEPRLSALPEKHRQLAKKSLQVVRSHIDNHGGIIASCDSSIYNYGRDYYSYVWPRDGAYTILPLIELGYKEEPRKFFTFCADTIHPKGYMMHKYQPDRSIGSTWHPQLHKNHPELPIQEDETAIVVYALGKYLQASNDVEFVHKLFKPFVLPAAEFMANFIDAETSLPHASYDLWEERFGTHSYTVFVTLAGLDMAVKIADRLNFPAQAEAWKKAIAKIAASVEKLSPEGYFVKSLLLSKDDGSLIYDKTIDMSSVLGPMTFALDNKYRPQLDKTVEEAERQLLNTSPSGGVPRYTGDNYFLTHHHYPGNPWIITTLWLAQYYLKTNQLAEAGKLLEWAHRHAGPSGMFSEQVDPQTGSPVGVCPLVWSHSTFLETVLMLPDVNGGA